MDVGIFVYIKQDYDRLSDLILTQDMPLKGNLRLLSSFDEA